MASVWFFIKKNIGFALVKYCAPQNVLMLFLSGITGQKALWYCTWLSTFTRKTRLTNHCR